MTHQTTGEAASGIGIPGSAGLPCPDGRVECSWPVSVPTLTAPNRLVPDSAGCQHIQQPSAFQAPLSACIDEQSVSGMAMRTLLRIGPTGTLHQGGQVAEVATVALPVPKLPSQGGTLPDTRMPCVTGVALLQLVPEVGLYRTCGTIWGLCNGACVSM